jgi:5-carboxymethyl-2-hydroxymuconate isomerase
MPHLRLEYSANIKEEIDPKKLFSACHQVLVNTVDADLFRCQSRAILRELFYVGEGFMQEAFICLEILLMEGRSLAKLQEMERELLKVLERYFARSVSELNLQIAVRVVELSKSHYSKLEFLKK